MSFLDIFLNIFLSLYLKIIHFNKKNTIMGQLGNFNILNHILSKFYLFYPKNSHLDKLTNTKILILDKNDFKHMLNIYFPFLSKFNIMQNIIYIYFQVKINHQHMNPHIYFLEAKIYLHIFNKFPHFCIVYNYSNIFNKMYSIYQGNIYLHTLLHKSFL